MFTQDMSNHVQTLAEHQLLRDMLYFHESVNLLLPGRDREAAYVMWHKYEICGHK